MSERLRMVPISRGNPHIQKDHILIGGDEQLEK